MSPIDEVIAEVERCFPRVSGDEPILSEPDRQVPSFSPRERG